MTVDMCCLGLSVAHTKFHVMWVVGLWIVEHDTMLRHAWVFSVQPCMDLFLRTWFMRTELLKMAKTSRPREGTAPLHCCYRQSVYHVRPNAHHVLQWPASILKTLVCQCHVQATYIYEGALQ